MSIYSIGYNSVNVSSGGPESTQNFSLSLSSSTSASTTQVHTEAKLYLTPYVANKIALYNGATWDIISPAQVHLSLSSFTAETNYDIFAYNTSGTSALILIQILF